MTHARQETAINDNDEHYLMDKNRLPQLDDFNPKMRHYSNWALRSLFDKLLT
jgi:phosphoglycerol transferase MdoB-like AlkP superfamily enzyme